MIDNEECFVLEYSEPASILTSSSDSYDGFQPVVAVNLPGERSTPVYESTTRYRFQAGVIMITAATPARRTGSASGKVTSRLLDGGKPRCYYKIAIFS